MRSIVLVWVALWSAGAIFAAPATRGTFDVRDFGARGDGVAIDSPAINRAIEAAAQAGGGTVVFTAGEYLSYSIRLKSNLTLRIESGATIIAAEPPPPGEPGGYDSPEPNEWHDYQDFGHSHFRNSLIWGESLENVSIVGPGRIYGRGLSRGNSRIALPVGKEIEVPPGTLYPDVLAADGDFEVTPRPELKPGAFGYPNARDTLANGVGNKAIALKNCRNVTLRDFSVLHGGHFAVIATGVDNLTIDNLLIDTNRDGIDIDACSNVRITNTSVNAPFDDAICLKSSHALGVKRPTENVTIANCYVSGFNEGTLLDGTRQRTAKHRGGTMGRIKLGTESGGGFRNIVITNCVFEFSRGLALEQVDGGVMEDIAISNITMRDVNNAPIFIRLAARQRAADAGVGTTRRILIHNLVAYNVAPEHGILISGVSGRLIEDVTLSNLQLYYRGGGTAEQAARVVPEYERDYPDPYNFGTMPSWGMFVRHVKNFTVRDVKFALMAPDERPMAFMDDATNVTLENIDAAGTPTATWKQNAVQGLRSREVAGLANTVGSTIDPRNPAATSSGR